MNNVFRRGMRLMALMTALTVVPALAASVTGRVVDAAGKPVKDAIILADNTLFHKSYVMAHTDANGKYRVDVSTPPGTRAVRATVELKHNGSKIKVDLVPENDRVVVGKDGGVRNFAVKPKPVTRDDPYGNLGRVVVSQEVGEYDLDESKIELTLTPVGKLADGSVGKVIKSRLQNTRSGYMLVNVMWGTYRVTATDEGRPLQLRRHPTGGEDYDTGSPWSSSYTGPFVAMFQDPVPHLYLEVKR